MLRDPTDINATDLKTTSVSGPIDSAVLAHIRMVIVAIPNIKAGVVATQWVAISVVITYPPTQPPHGIPRQNHLTLQVNRLAGEQVAGVRQP